MANISIEEIKKLKELSGVGLTDAKNALVEANGDFDKALEAMRKKASLKPKNVAIAKPVKVALILIFTMVALVLSLRSTAKLRL